MQIIQKIGIYVGLLLYATTAMGQNDTPTAASDTLAAEEQQQFLYYFYEAQRLIEKEDIPHAWELVQFCYELNPNDATINHQMSVFYEHFDNPTRAQFHSQRAFELSPNEYWYKYNLYLLQSNSHKSEKLAINNLKQTADNNPKDEDLHAFLQKAYIHVGDYEQALLLQDQIDSIVGYNAMSAMQRYRLNVVMDNTKQAIYEVERYLEEEPSDVQFQIFRMQLYEETNQPSEKMIEAYSAVLPYQPRNWVLVNNLAWHICISGGDLQQAEQLSRTTIMAEPSNPVFLDTYAWIMYQLGDYTSAFFYIQRALENATDNTYKEITAHYKAILKKLQL